LIEYSAYKLNEKHAKSFFPLLSPTRGEKPLKMFTYFIYKISPYPSLPKRGIFGSMTVNRVTNEFISNVS